MHPISENLKRHYEECFQKFGNNSQGVDWGQNVDNVLQRHKNMAKVFLNDPNFSLLDVGCGYGEFYDFLHENFDSSNFVYRGIDIAENMIDHAKRNCPNGTFFLGDFLEDNHSLAADYIICNGILTQKLNTSIIDMDKFANTLIKKMFACANKGIAFNIMSNKVNFTSDNLYYRSPVETLSWCLDNLSHNVIIDHSYQMYEFTVYVYRDRP